jgi:hypothetical protein
MQMGANEPEDSYTYQGKQRVLYMHLPRINWCWNFQLILRPEVRETITKDLVTPLSDAREVWIGNLRTLPQSVKGGQN